MAGQGDFPLRSAWLLESRVNGQGRFQTLYKSPMVGANDGTETTVFADWFFEAPAAVGTFELAATEAQDTAAVSLAAGTVGLALATTESADTALFSVEPASTGFALAATEQADTASVSVNLSTVGLVIAASETADTAAVSVNLTATGFALAATEGADVAAVSVAVGTASLTLAASEAADSASLSVDGDTPTVSAGGGFIVTGVKTRGRMPLAAPVRDEDRDQWKKGYEELVARDAAASQQETVSEPVAHEETVAEVQSVTLETVEPAAAQAPTYIAPVVSAELRPLPYVSREVIFTEILAAIAERNRREQEALQILAAEASQNDEDTAIALLLLVA